MGAHGKPWKPLGSGELRTEDHEEGLGHIVPIKLYNMVFFSLLFLTAVTVVAATMEFGKLNLFVALLIATVKAGIVTLVFMHLKFETKLIWGIVIYPIFIFLLMVAGTLGDFAVKDTMDPIQSALYQEAEEFRLNAEKAMGAKDGKKDDGHH